MTTYIYIYIYIYFKKWGLFIQPLDKTEDIKHISIKKFTFIYLFF